MNPALEEARRRWPGGAFETINHDGQPIGPGAEMRLGFVRGAQWQAKQPVEITGQMIRRGSSCLYAYLRSTEEGHPRFEDAASEVVDAFRDLTCAVLRAALGQSTSDGVGHLQTTVHR
jgi:hypothetical protein